MSYTGDDAGWTVVTRKDKRAREARRQHLYNLQILSDKILHNIHNTEVFMRMNRKLTGVDIYFNQKPAQDARQILPIIFDFVHFKITSLEDKQYFEDDRDKNKVPKLDVDLSYWVNRMNTKVVWMRVAKSHEFDGIEMYKDVPPNQDDREIGVVKFVVAGAWLKNNEDEYVYINI
jgi:hypothetical protein